MFDHFSYSLFMRTPLNKGMKKGRSCYEPRPSFATCRRVTTEDRGSCRSGTAPLLCRSSPRSARGQPR